MFTGKMPWDEESRVMVRGCDNEDYMMTIVSELYGGMELRVKKGRVSKDDLEEDGVRVLLKDIFSSEQPRKSRFLNFEHEHVNLKNLLDDIFEDL